MWAVRGARQLPHLGGLEARPGRRGRAIARAGPPAPTGADRSAPLHGAGALGGGGGRSGIPSGMPGGSVGGGASGGKGGTSGGESGGSSGTGGAGGAGGVRQTSHALHLQTGRSTQL